jgi:threonine aldolase
MLVGSREFIDKARIYRKMVGGGMRQAGVLAAAGLVALEKSPARLHEDHANARHLAEGLARLPGIHLDLKKVQTNIVIFGVAGTKQTAADLSRALAQRHVLAHVIGPSTMRMLTHCDVDGAGINRALAAFAEILSN